MTGLEGRSATAGSCVETVGPKALVKHANMQLHLAIELDARGSPLIRGHLNLAHAEICAYLIEHPRGMLVHHLQRHLLLHTTLVTHCLLRSCKDKGECWMGNFNLTVLLDPELAKMSIFAGPHWHGCVVQRSAFGLK